MKKSLSIRRTRSEIKNSKTVVKQKSSLYDVIQKNAWENMTTTSVNFKNVIDFDDEEDQVE